MNDLDNNLANAKGIGKTIATKVPMNVHDELVHLVDCGAYLSISDFLREAIREQLKNYKIADMRKINYQDAKREVISYFKKYKVCFLDEIAINLELEFELVNTILNDLVMEERIKMISKADQVFKDYLEENDLDESQHFSNKGNNFIKFKGKRIIVESSSKDVDFISLRPSPKNKSVLKSHGMVLNNGTVILSECYIFLK
ncbi:hypothetical protein mru_1236 [Methanobrevibacter ruminantium M1]|uniref:Ribbon-helix-helix protein CopG domain-containing protein n=1 Tax=Methanobrevibacter ruminantium (strain ATCC 35063 / DSM 1093 / JCM 13430 / OCM 146 / M1) TaxID=634498 RepID=D3E3H5_METRM|nr:hypothetical protein [Methanobrevibacter ruminantium]ADC47086.1 hypothetical protein mru_1236 [Methanobrevibacter ruminantium M1]